MSLRRAPSALRRPISRRPFGNRDEHDVHDADSADAEGHGADDAEEKIKGGAELHDLGRVGDGVPTGDGLIDLWGRSGAAARARRVLPGLP